MQPTPLPVDRGLFTDAREGVREVCVTLAATLVVGLVWAAYAASASGIQPPPGAGAIAETGYAGGASGTR